MRGPRTALPSSGPALPFCERCGNLIGAASTLSRIGLTMCNACGVYACGRCWARTAGACPGCGVTVAAAATAGVAQEAGHPPNRRSWDRRAPIAVGTVVLVVSALALVVGGPLRPTGGVEGATGKPAAVTSASPSTGQSPLALLSGGATPPIVSETPVLPSDRAVPLQTPTPTTRPRPAPTLTPRSTPRPTPRPTATPCVLKAPVLIGQRRNSAAGIWSGAGFTGAVTTLPGNGNYAIGSQDRIAGHTYRCDASVTVGP